MKTFNEWLGNHGIEELSNSEKWVTQDDDNLVEQQLEMMKTRVHGLLTHLDEETKQKLLEKFAHDLLKNQP